MALCIDFKIANVALSQMKINENMHLVMIISLYLPKDIRCNVHSGLQNLTEILLKNMNSMDLFVCWHRHSQLHTFLKLKIIKSCWNNLDRYIELGMERYSVANTMHCTVSYTSNKQTENSGFINNNRYIVVEQSFEFHVLLLMTINFYSQSVFSHFFFSINTATY